MAKVIGITGGIGAGKSLVIEYLKNTYSYTIIKADEVAHLVKEKGQCCYEPLIALLGEEVLQSNGEINREKMATMIFQDPVLLKKVNELIHPAVKEMILNAIQKETGAYIIIEAALLIEDGYLSYLDELWYIYASEQVRKNRLMKTRGYEQEKIYKIFQTQLAEELYKEHSDYVIDNSTTQAALFAQIDDIMKRTTV
ncbi:MAG: dephospho-CoA kinase [Eubacteriales bacterium]